MLGIAYKLEHTEYGIGEKVSSSVTQPAANISKSGGGDTINLNGLFDKVFFTIVIERLIRATHYVVSAARDA